MDKKLDMVIILKYTETNSLFSKNGLFLHNSNVIITVQHKIIFLLCLNLVN